MMYLLQYILHLLTDFRDISYPNGWEMKKDTESYQLNFTAPGVEVHCLYGIGVDTVER